MPTMPTLTDKDDGRAIDVRVGDTLELELSENATAGYSWAIDRLDPALFADPAHDGDYPAGAPGSAGVARFRIAVHGAGTGKLSLKYWRPWEGEAGVLRRFGVTVTARR